MCRERAGYVICRIQCEIKTVRPQKQNKVVLKVPGLSLDLSEFCTCYFMSF